MINLSDEEIAEFRRIWREEFGEEITIDYAKQRGAELIQLYVLLSRKLPNEQ